MAVTHGRTMRYGSLCSGIETAALAFPAHWEHAWCSEIDPFCCELLKARYPHVRNFGDITQDQAYPAIDVLVSGTPCQSFSAQGSRRGLDDPRGQLAMSFSRIARDVRPRWIIWENVANVLRVDGGRAFGAIIGELAKLRYGIAYRVLDAQFFGVPQRRRRVFVVGHYRDWRKAAAVMFDARANYEHEAAIEKVQADRLRSIQDSGEIVGWSGDETPKFGIGISPTLRATQGGEGNGFATEDGTVRQFTITEIERLQGVPDGYTDINEASRSQRKKAIGNAFCVNVMRWLGERIDIVDGLGSV